MADGNTWSVIFDLVEKRHPEAAKICEGLRNPLPDGYVGVAYLDFANTRAARQEMSQHPFDSDAGVARLLAYLSDRDPENYSHAAVAATAIPFINAGRRDALIGQADEHPDAFVRLESARALATTGSEVGRRRLAQLCLDPRLAERAVHCLEELGLTTCVPSQAREPGFRAMAAMCDWLMYPTEFGRPPDEIVEYDTRELNWPPTGDNRRLWLFKYRFAPQSDGNEVTEGIGLVGSTTFSLTGQVTADLPPEDVYGLHCCWELEIQQDPRAPKKRTAAIGRKMLAAANPGFPAA